MMELEIVKELVSLEMFKVVMSFVFIAFLLLIFATLLTSSRSKKARELYSDLFVIGTVRKLAKEDGIDLEEELKSIRRMEKLEKASMRSVDRMVEVELNEKISAKNQEALDKINKKA